MHTVGVMCGSTPAVTAVETVIRRTCTQTRHECHVVRVLQPDELKACDRVVLAPCGSLAKACAELSTGMGEALTQHRNAGKPCLGISLGMLLMFCEGGLGWFEGACAPLPSVSHALTGAPAKTPHVGWNRLILEPGCHPIIAAAGRSGTWMYFSHDQHAALAGPAVVSATTEYGPASIVAAVHQDNTVATLFRPERSHRAGIRLLVAFLDQG
jgi:glutamine amidotransferase